MKKLITSDTDGHPIYFRDLEFIQEQIRELTKASFGHLGDNKIYVLTGCNISTDAAGTITVGEGMVYYNGETFIVEAHQAYPSSDTEKAVWQIEEANDPRGEKKFKNGITRQVYLVRKMRVQYMQSVTALPISETQTIEKQQRGEWQELTLQTGFESVPGHKTLSIRKDILGNVHLIGRVDEKVGIAHWFDDEIICNIPEQFRPWGASDCGKFEINDLNNGYPCHINESGDLIRKANYNRHSHNLIFDFTYKV